MQAGMQAGTVQPVRIEDTTFAGAGRLHPAQGLGSFATVIGGEQEIPQSQSHNRGDDVDDYKPDHHVFLGASL
jgi:hypothetical protein